MLAASINNNDVMADQNVYEFEELNLDFAGEQAPNSKDVASQYFHYLLSCWPGLLLAGILYVIGLNFLLWGITFASQAPPSFFNADTILGMLLMTFLVSLWAGILLVISGVVSIILVVLFNWSFGNTMSPRLTTLCAGGLAGYLPTGCVFFWRYFENPVILELLYILFLGPIAATIVGGLGVHWYASKKIQRAPIEKPPFQFSIISLAAAVFWIALLFRIATFQNGWHSFLFVILWLVIQGSFLAACRCWAFFPEGPKKEFYAAGARAHPLPRNQHHRRFNFLGLCSAWISFITTDQKWQFSRRAFIGLALFSSVAMTVWLHRTTGPTAPIIIHIQKNRSLYLQGSLTETEALYDSLTTDLRLYHSWNSEPELYIFVHRSLTSSSVTEISDLAESIGYENIKIDTFD